MPPEEIAPRRRRRRLGRWLVLVALGVFALVLVGAAAMAGAVLAVSRGTPPLATLQARPQSQDTVLYDSSGAVIARLQASSIG